MEFFDFHENFLYSTLTSWSDFEQFNELHQDFILLHFMDQFGIDSSRFMEAIAGMKYLKKK